VYSGISNITWTVAGKVKTVTKSTESITFEYDQMGNRLSKEVLNSGILTNKQYYVRDASGNVMATYNKSKLTSNEVNLALSEVPLYGSDRLGLKELNEDLGTFTNSDDNPLLTLLQAETDFSGTTAGASANRELGNKRYELKDHLGNVRAVVSDKKERKIQQGNNYLALDGTDDCVVIPNSSEFDIATNLTIEAWINPSSVGGQNSIVTKRVCSGNNYSYWFRAKDGILQLMWSLNGSCNTSYIEEYATIDPVIVANQWQHVAVVHGNGEVKFYLDGALIPAVDCEYRAGDSFTNIKIGNAEVVIGARYQSGAYKFNFQGGIDDVRIWNVARTDAQISANKDTEPIGTETNLMASYNFNSSTTSTVLDNTVTASNGTIMGNPVRVASVVSTGAVICYAPQLLSMADYYAFGSQMPNRNANTNEYRYGFNGMEKDDEVKGNGNSYTTMFRQYDPRLGRWLSLDPKMRKLPFHSPYIAFANNPVIFVDPNGDIFNIGKNDAQAKKDVTSVVKKKHRKYLKFDSQTGEVTVDLSGVKAGKAARLQKKAGIGLINDLSTAKDANGNDLSFFYGTGNQTGVESEDAGLNSNPGNEKSWTGDINSTDKPNIGPDGSGQNVFRQQAFVTNASINVYDKKGIKKGTRPYDGYSGKVYIATGFFSYNNNEGSFITVNRAKLVEHELRENLFRTAFGYDYAGAHAVAGGASGSTFYTVDKIMEINRK
ncbi:MAG: RHS repeat-associated protein, partial [Salibacteraceae bacterium]